VDYIVCVGGSSNMPQVKKAFEKKYSTIPIKLFEPEKAIAFGAAIYAEHLTEAQFLRDICKFSYGIRFVHEFYEYNDEQRLRVYNKIYKGSPLPATAFSISTPVRDGYSSIYFALFESENTEEIYLPENGTQIGSVSVTGLINSKKEDVFSVTLEIDQSGLLQALAVENKTGKSATTEIQLKDF
jgi:molecular chaperone DnaK (HSP70)